MGVVIQVSYQHDDELAMILKRLDDLDLTVSTREYKSGKFRRCYLRSKRKLRTVPDEPDANQEQTKYPGA